MSLEVKVDKILDQVTEIKITLASQHEILKDHIRRTELLEKATSPSRVIALCAAIAGIIESLHWMLK
jgi:hypothetical protein